VVYELLDAKWSWPLKISQTQRSGTSCLEYTDPYLAALPNPYKSGFLDNQLLPLLSTSFEALTSLSLWWDTENIPQSALEKISRIKSLQKLHITVERVESRRRQWYERDWLINHRIMRTHLSRLPRLMGLAFAGDTYEFEGRVSQRLHFQRTAKKANNYFDDVPNLEWLFLGMIH
jgi:hypothetical protein